MATPWSPVISHATTYLVTILLGFAISHHSPLVFLWPVTKNDPPPPDTDPQVAPKLYPSLYPTPPTCPTKPLSGNGYITSTISGSP